MKKLLSMFLAVVMIFTMSIPVYAAGYRTGKVYVEGDSTAYSNGDTIVVERGKTIHIARIADGKAPLVEGDFWFSCWNPDTLTSAGFKLYGDGDEDGASFKNSDSAYGPYINTSKVKPGTYALNFFFCTSSDVFAHGFSGAKKYSKCTVYIKVTRTSQTLKPSVETQKVAYTKVKAKSITVSPIVKVAGAKTTLSYEKVSGSKYLTVNSETGAVTVKKGTPN